MILKRADSYEAEAMARLGGNVSKVYQTILTKERKWNHELQNTNGGGADGDCHAGDGDCGE